jgi:ankyrin repeat protein
MNSYKIFPEKDSYEQQPPLRFCLRLMYWGAHFNSTVIVEYFMKRKCCPFVECYDGYTVLHKAAERGSLEVLSLILSGTYYITNKTWEEHRGRKKYKVKRILDKKKYLDVLSTNHPCTPLHLAVENNHYDCARYLVSEGAQPHIVNFRNMPPFKLTSDERILSIYKDLNKGRKENLYEKGFLYVL